MSTVVSAVSLPASCVHALRQHAKPVARRTRRVARMLAAATHCRTVELARLDVAHARRVLSLVGMPWTSTTPFDVAALVAQYLECTYDGDTDWPACGTCGGEVPGAYAGDSCPFCGQRDR